MNVSIVIFIDDKDINIKKCIDSVLNQTLDSIEIIILSKCEDIKNINIIKEYKNNYKNIKLIFNESNLLNDYLSILQGEYVYFFNARDSIYRNSIEILYKESIKNDLDILCFDYNNINSFRNKNSLKNLEPLNGIEIYSKLEFIGFNFDNISLNFYKKNLLKENKIFFSKDIDDFKNIYKLIMSANKVKYIHDNIISNYNDYNEYDLCFYLNSQINSIKYLMDEYCKLTLNKDSYLKLLLKNIIDKKIVDIMNKSNKNLLFDITKELNNIIKHSNYKLDIKTELSINAHMLNKNIGLRNIINVDKEDELKLYKNSKKIFYMLLPEHGNLGDQAIVYSTLKFFEENYDEYEIIKFNFNETVLGVEMVKKFFNTGDFIVLHGGGNMGNLYLHEEEARRYIIVSLNSYPIVSFPQTIYFTEDNNGQKELELSKKYYNDNKNLVLLAREKRSYKLMTKIFTDNNVYLCPDIVFYLEGKINFKNNYKNQIMTCFRKDKESYYDLNSKSRLIESLGKLYSIFENDTIINYRVSHLDRDSELQNLWSEYSKSKVVITDRLHGMIFAVITKTPCIVLRSLDYKVLETYELIKDLNYIKLIDNLDLDTIKEIIKEFENIKEFDTISNNLFSFDNLKKYIDSNLYSYGYNLDNNIRNKIKINISYNDDSKILYNFNIDQELKRYFNYNNMSLKYSENLGDIPLGILSIPALANLLPISWFTDSDIYVDELDEQFYMSIPKIKSAYEKMYDLKLGGNIIVKKLVSNDYEPSKKYATLFSGGADSLSTVINNIDKDIDLVTIWGSDIQVGNKDGWKNVKECVCKIGNDFGLKNTLIISDFRNCLNYNELARLLHIKGLEEICWWTYIQHGISLISHLVPYAYKYKMSKIYIPGTLDQGYIDNYGLCKLASDPTIDNEFKFASCSTIHEGFEYTRQDKITNICNYKKSTNCNFDIRVCFSSYDGQNCNKCKKCSITILGLIQQKQDPDKYGFKVNESLLIDMKYRYENEFIFDHFALNWWKNIKNKFLQEKEFWMDYPCVSWIMFIDTTWEYNLSKSNKNK